MKNFLILSGGGFKGAFQVGAIEVFKEKGIVFDRVFGISTGAMNGSMASQGKLVELKRIWEQIHIKGQSEIFCSTIGEFKEDELTLPFSNIKKVALEDSFKSLLVGNFKEKVFSNIKRIDSLFNMLPLREKLLENIKLEDFISDFHFGVTDFNTGQYHLLNNKDFFSLENLVDGIVSSGSLPIISKPIKYVRTYETTYYNLLDGGVRKTSPIGDAIKYVEEDTHFYIVNCNTGYVDTDTSNKSVFSILTRTIDIMMSQMFIQDLDMFKTINDLTDGTKYKKIPYTLIESSGDVLGDPLRTSNIDCRYDLGRKLTLKKFM